MAEPEIFGRILFGSQRARRWHRALLARFFCNIKIPVCLWFIAKTNSTPRRMNKQSSPPDLYTRIREILELARAGVARTVNTTQVVANWLIGRELVMELQKGEKRADYGTSMLVDVSRRLRSEFGSGYSVDNLEWFRAFYLGYPHLLDGENSDAARRNSTALQISDALRRELPPSPRPSELPGIRHTARGESVEAGESLVRAAWGPGRLNPNLSWTHYRTLVRVDRLDARAFYEIEAVKNNWSARELERQINSLLFERLARSKDKSKGP